MERNPVRFAFASSPRRPSAAPGLAVGTRRPLTLFALPTLYARFGGWRATDMASETAGTLSPTAHA